MNDKFRGWTSVYGFTFKEATKGTAFKVVTTMITLVLLIALVLINIFSAKPDKDDGIDEVTASPIKTVYVLDQSGLEPTDFKTMNPQFTEEQFEHIEFIQFEDQSRDAIIQMAQSHSSEAIAIVITKVEKNFEIEAIVPDESEISSFDAEVLLGPITSGFETNKLLQSGLSDEQLTTITKPIVTSFQDIGEDENEMASFIQIFAPMLFGLIIYMMLLLHGQNVSKSVSVEKTSKLMETMLTSIHPYAMITGKVMAITSVAILQFLTWIVAVIVGLFGGNAIARLLYPEYENTVITIINFARDNIGDTAFSIPALLIAIFFFCIGFLFYNVIASLAGALVSKPEDVASTQILFLIPIIISFFITYLAPLMEYKKLIVVTRYIPFTSPFTVPVDLVTGSVNLLEGLISLVILLIATLLMILLVSRIYKGLVLYHGQKLSLKTIGQILKNK